jgi:hypothetical protein
MTIMTYVVHTKKTTGVLSAVSFVFILRNEDETHLWATGYKLFNVFKTNSLGEYL